MSFPQAVLSKDDQAYSFTTVIGQLIPIRWSHWLISYWSLITSSSESECNFESFPSLSKRQSIDSTLEKFSDLSDISEDEDAINVDMMRDFSYYGPSRDSLENSGTIEFSASACQRIHSELLASVNQIYVNLQGSVAKNKYYLNGAELSVYYLPWLCRSNLNPLDISPNTARP